MVKAPALVEKPPTAGNLGSELNGVAKKWEKKGKPRLLGPGNLEKPRNPWFKSVSSFVGVPVLVPAGLANLFGMFLGNFQGQNFLGPLSQQAQW